MGLRLNKLAFYLLQKMAIPFASNILFIINRLLILPRLICI